MNPGNQDADGGESLRVILVEGDEMTREFLRSILEEDGTTVSACATARQALDLIPEFKPDLLLATFPSIPGDADLVEGVREQFELAALPIVFLSSEDDDHKRFKAIAAGADDFLVKPVSPPILIAAIRGRIARARMLEREAPVVEEPERLSGPLRRGEFLGQLGGVLRGDPGPWQVLMALRLDQPLGEKLGQAGAFELEQAIAARFASALREDDAYTLWMEFGFGVLAERDNRAQLEALAQSLCECVASAPFKVRGQEFALSLSVGIALAPTGADEGDPDRWFASAYAAQAIAHRLGGNRFDGVLSRDHGNMPPERVLIIREWAKEARDGGNVLIEFQPVLPLQLDLAGLYTLDAKLRDYRAPLAGVHRKDYLGLARDAGSLAMIDRMSLFSAFEAIEEERARGRMTRVLVPMDLLTINDAQLIWLDAELRRRKAHSDGLIIEFDADAAIGRPELSRVVQRLEDQGVVIAISDTSGTLDRIHELQKLPAGILRLPVSAVDSVAAATFVELLTPWQSSGRGLIADGVENVDNVGRLWELNIDYVQGDGLAASSPRLDYEFTQFGV
jgi:CheY-like chemotaxis protein/EAL domain-containing protein (putative c-di-GMP-specific phosphodiesterase class I)